MVTIRLKEIEKIWKDYQEKYPILKEYKFELSNRLTKTFGQCNNVYKHIKLRKNYALTGDWIEVKHTILHEIAHALSPIYERHGKHWRANCEKLGIPPLVYHNKSAILAHYSTSQQEPYVMYLGHKCKKIITQSGNNTVITYEKIL